MCLNCTLEQAIEMSENMPDRFFVVAGSDQLAQYSIRSVPMKNISGNNDLSYADIVDSFNQVFIEKDTYFQSGKEDNFKLFAKLSLHTLALETLLLTASEMNDDTKIAVVNCDEGSITLICSEEHCECCNSEAVS